MASNPKLAENNLRFKQVHFHYMENPKDMIDQLIEPIFNCR